MNGSTLHDALQPDRPRCARLRAANALATPIGNGAVFLAALGRCLGPLVADEEARVAWARAGASRAWPQELH